MARYDAKFSKTDKAIEGLSNVISIKRKPIVIPKDKLEAAHLKVKQAQDREKAFMVFSIIAILAILVIYNIK